MERDQAALEDLCARLLGPETVWAEVIASGIATLCLPESADGFGGGAPEVWTLARAAGAGGCLLPVMERAVLPALLLESAGRDGLLAGVLEGREEAVWAGATPLEAGPGGLFGSIRLPGGSKPAHLLGWQQGHGLVRLDTTAAEWHPAPWIDGAPGGTLVLAAAAPDPLLAKEGAALAARLSALSRLALAAEIAGACERAVELTRDHLILRRQFGSPLSAFQALRHRLVDAMIAAQEAHALSLAAVLVPEGGEDAALLLEAALAKAVEAASLVGEEAVQMHGGTGMTEAHEVSRLFRRLTALSLAAGGSDAALRRLAEGERRLLP